MADNELKIKISAEVQKLGLADLKKEFKETQKTLDELRQAGKQNSKEWDDAKSRAGVLSNEIKKLNREYRGLDGQVKASKFQMLEFGENLTVVTAGLFMVGKAIAETVKAFKDLTVEGAEFGVWKDAFTEMQGGAENTAKALELMYRASSGNLDEKEIILYTNKMKMLGFTLDDSAKLLKLVDIQGDKMGVTFRQGQDVLQGFIMTGRKMALKEMGINAGEVTKKIDELTIATGKSKDALSDEEIQAIRLNAILQVTGVTMKEVTDSELDAADKLLMFESATRNAKLEIGQLISKGLIDLIDKLGATSQSATSTAGYITAIGSEAGKLLPVLAALKIAFPAALAGIAAVAWKVAAAIGVVGAQVYGVYKAVDSLITIFENFVDTVEGNRSVFRLFDLTSTEELNKKEIVDVPTPTQIVGMFDRIKQGYGMMSKYKESLIPEISVTAPKKTTTGKGGKGTTPKEKAKELKESSEGLAEAIRELAREMQFENTVLQGGMLSDETLTKLRTFNESWLTLSERIENNERMKSMNEMLSESIYGVADAMGVFMESLASGDIDGFKNFMKQIVNAFITSVQAMLFAAGSAAAAKGITSFGLSLITDLPQIAAAWVGLELAKGLIQGLATGGQAQGGTPYIVGERGRELFIPNQSGYVMNNRNLEMALAGAGGSPNIYINANMKGIEFLKEAFPQYINYTKFKRI